MKTISIAGRLTKDAEMKRTQAGDAILQFSVAVDDWNGKEKSALFFDCALFGKRAQNLDPHLTKGSSVSVSGDFGTYITDQGKTYLKIRCNDVTLQGGGQSKTRQEEQPSRQGQPANFSNEMDDEIPFSAEFR